MCSIGIGKNPAKFPLKDMQEIWRTCRTFYRYMICHAVMEIWQDMSYFCPVKYVAQIQESKVWYVLHLSPTDYL